MVNDPPLAEISTSGLAEVWRPVGPIASGKTLLLANSTGALFRSHDGASWETLCVAPAGLITGLAVRGKPLLLLAQAEGRSHVHRGTIQRDEQPGCAWDPQAAQLQPLAPDAAVGDDGRSLTGIAVDPAGTVWVAVPNTQPGQASYVTLYASADAGLSFAPRGNLGRDTASASLLPLADGAMLAAARYARFRGVNRAGPSYDQAAVLRSGDGALSWSAPGLASGYKQTPSALLRAGNATVLVTTSIDCRWSLQDIAQRPAVRNCSRALRYILSYDGGRSFTSTVFEVHRGAAAYGASAALPG
eukprot:COSAG04_NODE_2484_length_4035_cov_5.573425_5_plen_301_part_01